MFKPGPVAEAFHAYSEAQKIMIQSVMEGNRGRPLRLQKREEWRSNW